MIVSIVNEIALDEGSPFAGGLGVLEADKVYTFARKNKEYLVLTPLYPSGYIKYEFNDSFPQPVNDSFPPKLFSLLKEVKRSKIKLRDKTIETAYYEYKSNNAKVVFIKPVEDSEAESLFGRLYDHGDKASTFYRYLYFSKACVDFLEGVGLDRIKIIDIQESFTAFIPLMLKDKPNRPRIRLVIHTPVPWGHPVFDREFFEKELGIDFNEKEINMTVLASSLCDEIITVSRKHEEVSKKLYPQFTNKIKHVTNGIDIERWMDPELRKLYLNNSLDNSSFYKAKLKAKQELISFIKDYKHLKDDRMTIIWARRTVLYKRPHFILNFIEENQGIEANFILAGKTDPRDHDGLHIMKRMKELSDKFPNVIYIWKYDLVLARKLFSGADLNLFTPLSGWEASGTSMMKAGVNGTPTLSSRDGASLELIKDGYNGWFFGRESQELIPLGSEKVGEVDKIEYDEFNHKLKYIIKTWYEDRETFINVAINAIKSFYDLVSSERMLKEYYAGYI